MTTPTSTSTIPSPVPAPITAPDVPAGPTTGAHPRRRFHLLDVIKGEWVKFRSVRSTSIALIGAAVATVALGMIFSATAGSAEDAPNAAVGLTDPVQLALGAVDLTAMIVGVLGVLIIAGEYSTGLIRTTFAAVGNRVSVLGSKAVVLGLATMVVMSVTTVLALWLGQGVYAGDDATLALTDPDAVGVIVGTTVYVTGIALIGLSLGSILRSTASGIGVLVGGVFILPGLMQLLPDSFTDVVLKYLPSEAGSVMMSPVSDPSLLSTGEAYVVFAAWVLGLLVVAGVLTRTRDA
jgi:ABC-type transport system involved in multi-copper enzyme maturation permease subunit